ncbi:MAG TPA: hypothetical protein VEH06_11125, partial [Candidatus Bathyarchaeia archaeon]|nr:hypothetical protein [Candidatus Bathyarchaeia archaeon]
NSNSNSNSNITGNSAGGGSSGNAEGGLEYSEYKDSSTKSGSGESTVPNDVTSESSGSSSSSNSTGTTGGKLGRSQDSTIGSDSGVSNSRGGTEGNDTNSGKYVIPQMSMQTDMPTHPSCSSLDIEIGKIPGNICSPRHGKAFSTSYGMEGSSTNDKNNNLNNESTSNINPSPSPTQTRATHCDQPGSPSCYSLGFQDGKSSAGTNCPSGHSTNYCSGWKAGSEVTGLGTTREIAPGAPAGSHTLEYIQAFNTAAGNPYKPGTKQYQNYQAGLKDAKKAGRDCDKMDTCGGPDLLGNYLNGALHLSNKQYCGNGFGVYSIKLCKFREGCIATIMGTLTCPSSELPLAGKVATNWRK